METKNYMSLEIKKGDFVFTFNMPIGSTWPLALDAAWQAVNYAQSMTNQALEASKNESSSKDAIEAELVEK